MRKFWAALAIVFMLSPLGGASADIISVSQEIHITGVVAPMRFIVLDGHGNIVEITSNTPENVTPQVYVGSIQHGQPAALTPALLKDYESKIRGHDMHSTDLHFAPASPVALKTQKSNLVSFLTHVSLLRTTLFHSLF